MTLKTIDKKDFRWYIKEDMVCYSIDPSFKKLKHNYGYYDAVFIDNIKIDDVETLVYIRNGTEMLVFDNQNELK